MNEYIALPSRPLAPDDIERVRGRSDVEAVVSIGGTSVRDRRCGSERSVTNLVVLVRRTVLGYEYTATGWSVEVLETDATPRDHVECALDRLNGE